MEGQIIEHVWILEIILDDFFCKKKIGKLTDFSTCRGCVIVADSDNLTKKKVKTLRSARLRDC